MGATCRAVEPFRDSTASHGSPARSAYRPDRVSRPSGVHEWPSLANIYKTHLHTQHIIDRVLEGYKYGDTFRKTALDVGSIYVEQRGEGDLVPERAARHKGMKVCGSVARH